MMDDAGQITMRARKSELVMIDRTAWYPRDIEEALLTQAGVEFAALVGIPNDVGTIQPVAFVTSSPNRSDLDQGRLKEGIAPLVPYDLKRLQVRIVDRLPMTPTGKIAKAELVAMFAT